MKGVTLAVISAVAVGISIVFASIAAKTINPIYLAGIGSFVGGLVMLLLSPKFSLKEIKQHKKALTKIIISRSFLASAILMTGLSLTTAINANIMLRFEPIFVVIIGFLLLKKKLTGKQIGLMLAIVIGGIILSTGGILSWSEGQLGDLLIIIAMTLTAYSYFPAKTLNDKLGAINATKYVNIIGGLLLIITAFLIYGPIPIPSFNDLLIIGAYIFFFFVIGLPLWFKSLGSVPEWLVASLQALQVISGVTLAWLWLGNTLNAIQLFGAGVILVGSYLLVQK